MFLTNPKNIAKNTQGIGAGGGGLEADPKTVNKNIYMFWGLTKNTEKHFHHLGLRLDEIKCTHFRILTFFAHSLELVIKTGVILTPRQSQPRSCFLYSLQILVYYSL